MTESQPLSDVDLLVWAVVLGYRARQQRAGLKFVLMPFPPCPSCGEGVHTVNQVAREQGPAFATRLTMQPCRHAHLVADDDVYRLRGHIDHLIDRVERDDRSDDPDVRGWMVDDIAQAARALVAPPEPLSAPRSVPQASGGELAGRNGDRSPQAASSDALRERLVDSLANYPVDCWTPRNLAGRVMGVVGGDLDRSEKVARESAEQLARVRKVIAERRAEVAEREVDGMLPFGTPGASWCDAVTVTCDRIDDALRVHPEPGWIRCNDDQAQEQP